jgi:hypothetical protein
LKYASIAAIALLIGTFSLGLGVANNSSSLWVPFPDSDDPRTFGIPLLLGREFNKADAPNATRVIIINEAFAAKVYPGEDPVGKVLHCNGARELGGVLAYSVTQRTHEMSVRMALGAEKTDVIKLVIRQGLSLTLAGIALGLAVSRALNKVLEKMMFEIGTTDTVTFFGATVIFLVVAMAACVIPAIRAMRVHP